MTQSQDSDAHIGRVITVYSGCCDVLLGEEIRLCNLRDTIAKTQKTTLAVGDKVRVINLDDARPLVDEVLPRTTSLSRPDPLKPEIERVLVANVDCVAIVVAARKPAPRPGIIDRIWVAAQRGGAQTRIIVNKMDLTKDRHRAVIEELMSEYEALEVPVHYVSTVTGAGISELKAALANQVSSIVGHSGVGKSSLINALLEGELARTSEVRQSTGKGRHTTRSEEHTSELQSRGHLVCRLLLEKKKLELQTSKLFSRWFDATGTQPTHGTNHVHPRLLSSRSQAGARRRAETPQHTVRCAQHYVT